MSMFINFLLSFKINLGVRRLVSFLKHVFHLPFVFLILYPYLIGVLINYSISDHRELIILFSWLPLIILPCFFTSKSVFSHIGSFILFINGFTNLFHWLLVKAPLSATGVYVFFNSNFQESVEFLSLKSNLLLLLLVPYLVILIWAVKKPLIKSTFFPSWYILILVIYSFVFIIENAIHERFIRKGVPVLVKTTISFYEEIKALEVAIIENRRKPVQAKKDDNESNTFVLIIGESVNRNHMSVYGYTKETTPHIKNSKDIIVYKNVISPHCHTLEAVRAALTESNIDNRIKFSEASSIIDVAKAAGYKTFWLSNQSPLGIWDNFITVLAKTADVSNFYNISGSSSLETSFKKSDDINLLYPLNNALNDSSKNKFIILHLMGSHAQYHLRYPSEFDRFNYGEDKKRKTVSEYDNSILYTDFIIDSIFKIIKQRGEKNNESIASLYFSDHGENVYDDLGNVGHDYTDSIPYSLVEIPFIYFSPKINNFQNKEIFQLFESRSPSSYMTDDLFHSLISLLQIKTPLWDSTRSLFSVHYNQYRKRILENGQVYRK